ncbi:MAG: hypothetical protein HeimC2_14310 [Candidatus Heimdallarchaeota archaeon LC_2]|nr:MAG: hypothetical protein HeimC2_14310 [Candidatus Heimdallarchaeota archaeon LC_2]
MLKLIKRPKTFFLLVILVALFFNAPSVHIAESSFSYSAGTITGATMADLANISYTNMGIEGLGLSENSRPNSFGFIRRVAIRSAFSIRAAVILMDAHDSMWEDKLGLEVFTGVPGTDFSSATVFTEKYHNYFDSKTEDGISIHLGATTLNDTDGDISGNKTLSEDSYRANVNYKNFKTDDYGSLNSSELENLDSTYTDLTDLLLETPEVQADWKEKGNQIVAAGHSDLEDATLQVLKKRIEQIENIPSNQIRVDNYTLSEIYLEQVVSEELSDDVKESYNTAKSAGFLPSFKIESPIKVVTSIVGATTDAYKGSIIDQGIGFVKDAPAMTWDTIRGSTAVQNAIALKDTVVTGVTTTWTGIKDAPQTAWNTITDGASALKSGTEKLVKKGFSLFSSLSTKFKNILKWGLVIGGILLVVGVVLYLKYQMNIARMATAQRPA